ncbi:MAG: tRNA (N6-threonylcarbamoyladenosine(37)-N6)-methyltransferase TrmO [Dactylosporangium sp.]|nr:SAM-dependent methyltransferase [Dactylosporangium sp.]NNJ60424.1 tRNA (N6-threonylcarbamoyladenosine(37)-N6)-methyltransferase TrmO [Dactylosporangium sp.]
MEPATAIHLTPIGHVTRESGIELRLDEPYRAGLSGLGDFGHVVVVWWAGRYDVPEARQVLTVPLPYADNREVGVFACRAPVRPNLVMTTVCAIERVDQTRGVVEVGDIDAFDGTPLLDLKPYHGVTDRVRRLRVPEYVADWAEWLPESGTALMPGEA